MVNKRIFLLPLMILCISNCSDNNPKEFQGYIEADNIYIASPYSGTLEVLAVKRGQAVNKDQLLFQLDKNPEILQVSEFKESIQQAIHLLRDLQQPKREPEIEAIKAQIEQDKANKLLTDIRLKRQQALLARGATNQDAVDEVLARYKQLEQLIIEHTANLKLAQLGSRKEQIEAQISNVERIREQFKQALWRLQQKNSKAPFAGLIFDTYFREGEFVPSQQPILSLLTPQNIHIEFFIPNTVLNTIHLGQSITFTATNYRSRSTALISYISPEAEYMPPLIYSRENNEKLVFRIQATFNEFDKYKPGQPVTVYLP